MPVSMELPLEDRITLRQNQLRQHKINFEALKSVYEVQQGLIPPVPAEDIKKTIDGMRQEQQAAQIIQDRIQELQQSLPVPPEKSSIAA